MSRCSCEGWCTVEGRYEHEGLDREAPSGKVMDLQMMHETRNFRTESKECDELSRHGCITIRLADGKFCLQKLMAMFLQEGRLVGSLDDTGHESSTGQIR